MLLHGVTGSGKTEVYLRAAKHALSQGGGCIVLVPEIGLLPQAVARYRRVFGDSIAVLHSRLTGPERFAMWKLIESGERRLVLGPRSAVFSPVKDLNLIIVDEEHDDSYKQSDKPRYHARSVALMRGKRAGLTVVLGSATPSAESFHQAASTRYSYLSLPQRIEGTPLPKVHFVDMRVAEREGAFLSSHLLERLEANLASNHQSILFLNKRGHARFVLCNTCGWVARCENCDISLTYHRVNNRLKCHFCGYNLPGPKECGACSGRKLYFSGVGTQRVELDLVSFFPGVGILRMDADTTSGKEGHRRVLEEFSTGKYPILVGTQMVTKGHHFPQVNLVGVLFAEESLNYPDFRSSERTFQQLTQVAGRAGRASSTGEVVIQTFTPEHHVFSYLPAYDYDGFMREELRVRKKLNYPPFSRIVLASCASSRRDVLRRVMERWSAEVRRLLSGRPADVLGPAPPVVARVKNRYREQLLIKGHLSAGDKRLLLESFTRVAESERGGRAVELRWDVDPETFY
jgi:primosomal protein N' (replication factor Y)